MTHLFWLAVVVIVFLLTLDLRPGSHPPVAPMPVVRVVTVEVPVPVNVGVPLSVTPVPVPPVPYYYVIPYGLPKG